jgi:hypothetical protein
MQNLYYDDAGLLDPARGPGAPLRVALLRQHLQLPLVPQQPALPGPDGNNVRTYTNASDYTRLFNNNRAQIAVMGPDIAANILKFDYTNTLPRAAGAMAKAGAFPQGQAGRLQADGLHLVAGAPG